MTQVLMVGAGGFAGAVARYALSGWVHRRYGGPYPLGTLTVNVLGCFLIGLCLFLVEERQLLGPQARLFFMVGVLGSLTTFSTFGYETLELIRAGQGLAALLNVAANVGAGLVAVGGALVLARTLG